MKTSSGRKKAGKSKKVLKLATGTGKKVMHVTARAAALPRGTIDHPSRPKATKRFASVPASRQAGPSAVSAPMERKSTGKPALGGGSITETLLRRFETEIARLVGRLASADVHELLARPTALDGLAVLVSKNAVAPAQPDPLIAAMMRGRAHRVALLAQVPSMSVAEAAGFLHISEQAVLKRIDRKAVVALRDGGEYRLPLWQFNRKTGETLEGVAALVQAAKEAALDPWDLQSFLSGPLHLADDENTALAWFLSGRATEVMQLVRSQGTHAA